MIREITGPVGVLGQWSRDLVTFADGEVRSSFGGPIAFIISTLAELGVGSFGCGGESWHSFPPTKDLSNPYTAKAIVEALQVPGYEIAFDEQDTARPPEVRVPSGITNLAPCLESHPAFNTLVLSSIFSDLSAQLLTEFRARNDVSIVLDIQGFQRIFAADQRIERAPADPRYFMVADVIKGNRQEFERQFGSNCSEQLTDLAEKHEALYLMTEGARGLTIFEPGRAPVSVPVIERRVESSVGAGDRFLAAFVAYRACGEEVRPAVELAQDWVRSVLGRATLVH